MQRPEAWPRPHPGEGAAAAPAGGPAPPARGREPAGLRLQEPSLYTIKAVFILDNDGHRLLAKYYDDTFPSMKEQMAFEKNVFNKTSRTDSKCPPFARAELSDAHHHLHLDTSVPVGLIHPQAIPFSSEVLFPLLLSCSLLSSSGEIAFFGGMTIVYKSSIDLFLYVVGSSYENELMLMSVLTCLFESLNHVLRKNVEKRWLLENMDGAFLVLDEIVDGGVILESDPQQVIQKVNFRADDSGLTEHSVAQVLQSAKEQIKWSLLK
ncbi:coatomer subunit zeta-2 isoform X2 [Physeter macrocephalus]|uniref:Coatomer subunit zeta n=1 Tax=Physeter macrocephalus TaxID=9755 RepID=A0A455B6W4_PHYMC|nr:coatomer subunit zeta-2 isoform X2 [Physeter catodon]|eukprot:XP_028339756.1 coatomer subunit zeta-2 isoform X2 [Physeter catodon]